MSLASSVTILRSSAGSATGSKAARQSSREAGDESGMKNMQEALTAKKDTMPAKLSNDMKLSVSPVPVPGKTPLV